MRGWIEPKAMEGAAARLFRPMYAVANMGHPSREEGFVLTEMSPIFSSLTCINLRALQPVGVVDIHRLPRAVKIKRARSAFPVTVAGVLHSPEGQMHLRPDRRRVHIGNPGLQVTHRFEGQVHVAGIERSR